MGRKETPVLPPSDLRAEQSVIGCELVDNSKISVVSEILESRDFYSDIHQTIQSSILVVMRDRGAVDLLILSDYMLAKGTLEDVGGAEYLLTCLESVPYAAHAAVYAEIVISHSRRRKAIKIADDLLKKLRDLSNESSEVVDAAHDSAMRMAEALSVKKSQSRLLSEGVTSVIEDWKRGQDPTVRWTINEIDDMTDGWALGELVVLAGSTSHGKSMIAMQMLDCAAVRGVPCLMISEEMEMSELASRVISSFSQVTRSERKDRAVEVEVEAKQHFSDRAPILVSEYCETIGKVEIAVDRAVQSHGIKLVAIDYAQFLSGDGNNREQEIGNISKRSKGLARKHGIIVLLLAQLNRKIFDRNIPTPQLNDIRDSGSLAQDADVVLMPYWPSRFNPDYEPPDEYRIFCAKSRNRPGAGLTIDMRIDEKRQRLFPKQPSLDFDHHFKTFD